jgi:hypothetical protein
MKQQRNDNGNNKIIMQFMSNLYIKITKEKIMQVFFLNNKSGQVTNIFYFILININYSKNVQYSITHER